MSATLAPEHGQRFRARRFWNWIPMGLAYALLYMGRYNLTVSKTALGPLMTKEDFGLIFGAGTFTYAFAFLLNGPLVDKIGGLAAAIDDAADKAGLEEGKYEVRVHPRPKNFLEDLFADLAPQKKDDDKHISSQLLEAATPALTAIDPQRLQLLQQALRQLDILQKEGVMLTMPVLDVTP